MSYTLASRYGEEEQEVPGRVRSDTEYTAVCRSRADIFVVERQRGARTMDALSVVTALVLGMVLSRLVIEVPPGPDFIDKPDTEGVVRTGEVPSVYLPKPRPQTPPPETQVRTSHRTLRMAHSRRSAGRYTPRGDPRQRVTRAGIFRLLSQQVIGASVATGDPDGLGGFASQIALVLSGPQGIRSHGGSGEGRRGLASIGYGPGYGPGSGEGTDVASLMDDLMRMDARAVELQHKDRKRLTISEPPITGLTAIVGGRTRSSIMRVVMQNLPALRHEYNLRLHLKPNLRGKVTVKFAIDEFGKVIFCRVVESTLHDKALEDKVAQSVRLWVFESIDKPGDITEVVYPFVFSQ